MLLRGTCLRLAAASIPLLASSLVRAQEPPPAPVGPPPADSYVEPVDTSTQEPKSDTPRPGAAEPSPAEPSPAEPSPAEPTPGAVPAPAGAPPPISPAAPNTAEGQGTVSSARNVYEPPPPPVYEPPPPLEPRHLAPRISLWTGARAGWFLPFGDVLARCTDRLCYDVDSIGWRRYASPGPLIEVDAGARLGRNYTLFLLWERAWLGAGGGPPESQGGGNTDFWALAVRFSSDPDNVGFLTEIAFGYRRARVDLGDGSKLRLDNAPFEARLGLGADIRLSRLFSLSPLVTLGVGRFDDVVQVEADGSRTDLLQDYDPIAHGSLTLQIGGHFDLLGSG